MLHETSSLLGNRRGSSCKWKLLLLCSSSRGLSIFFFEVNLLNIASYLFQPDFILDLYELLCYVNFTLYLFMIVLSFQLIISVSKKNLDDWEICSMFSLSWLFTIQICCMRIPILGEVREIERRSPSSLFDSKLL